MVTPTRAVGVPVRMKARESPATIRIAVMSFETVPDWFVLAVVFRLMPAVSISVPDPGAVPLGTFFSMAVTAPASLPAVSCLSVTLRSR